MTPKQRQTLHRILLDAKAEIKDGKLYDHDGDECTGICQYVAWHKSNKGILEESCTMMYQSSPFYKGSIVVAPPFDFSHPDRLALLDWLINETKP